MAFRKPKPLWVLYRNLNSPYIERQLEDMETTMMRDECCSNAIYTFAILRNDPRTNLRNDLRKNPRQLCSRRLSLSVVKDDSGSRELARSAVIVRHRVARMRAR